MPTVGWIRETDEDRYWEARAADLNSATPARFECPFCSDVFKSELDRATHISSAHPIERPVLFLNGQNAPSKFSLRTVLTPSQISIANCTGISVVKNGAERRYQSQKRFAADLLGERRGLYQVTLENSRIADGARTAAKYRVHVAIANETSLNTIDEEFLRYIATDDLRTSGVRRFADFCEVFPDAEDYYDALAEYAFGVLAKDQTGGTTLTFKQFTDKFSYALAVLSDYSRPVAQAICASVRFNLNDFAHLHPPSGVALLDSAIDFFSGLCANCQQRIHFAPSRAGKKLTLCPIDGVTEEILEAFSLLRGKFDSSKVDGLASKIDRGTLSEFDRAKLRAIVSALYLRTKHKTLAKRNLRALEHDQMLGAWAATELESL